MKGRLFVIKGSVCVSISALKHPARSRRRCPQRATRLETRDKAKHHQRLAFVATQPCSLDLTL